MRSRRACWEHLRLESCTPEFSLRTSSGSWSRTAYHLVGTLRRISRVGVPQLSSSWWELGVWKWLRLGRIPWTLGPGLPVPMSGWPPPAPSASPVSVTAISMKDCCLSPSVSCETWPFLPSTKRSTWARGALNCTRPSSVWSQLDAGQ